MTTYYSLAGSALQTDIRFDGTDYFGFGMQGCSGENGTESTVKRLIEVSGTASLFTINVAVNSSSSSWTAQSRHNGANGNQVCSVSGSSFTGQVQDTSHTDSITAGDSYNFDTSGGSFLANTSISSYYTAYNVSSGGMANYGSFSNAGMSNASSTAYLALAGINGTFAGSFLTPESNAAIELRAAGTLAYLQATVSSNSNANAVTMNSRVNSGAGNQSISITASTTGSFVDSSHSDSISSGNTSDIQVVTGSGSLSWNLGVSGMTFTSSTNYDVLCGGGSGTGLQNSVNNYQSIWGAIDSDITTEAEQQTQFPTAGTFSNLRAYYSGNSTSQTTTGAFRIGGSSGNQATSTSSTGLVEDTSHQDSVTAGSLVDTVFTAGGGTISVNYIAMMVNTSTSTTWNESISESLTAADSPGGNVDWSESVSESLSASDTIGVNGDIPESISESLSAADSIGVTVRTNSCPVVVVIMH